VTRPLIASTSNVPDRPEHPLSLFRFVSGELLGLHRGALRASVETSTITLAAVAHTLVSDVANVVLIDTLRSAPLIVDRSTNAKPALE
jgi:hypothetical protein